MPGRIAGGEGGGGDRALVHTCWGLWRGGRVNAVVEVGVRMSPRSEGGLHCHSNPAFAALIFCMYLVCMRCETNPQVCPRCHFRPPSTLIRQMRRRE